VLSAWSARRVGAGSSASRAIVIAEHAEDAD